MRAFFIALYLLFLGPIGSAWRFRAIKRGIVAGALVAGGLVLPVLADLDEDADVGAVVARPISFVSVESGTISTTKRAEAQTEQDDSSYLSSLAREQKKQDSQKKTKAQRAKDLCEKLGRGC